MIKIFYFQPPMLLLNFQKSNFCFYFKIFKTFIFFYSRFGCVMANWKRFHVHTSAISSVVEPLINSATVTTIGRISSVLLKSGWMSGSTSIMPFIPVSGHCGSSIGGCGYFGHWMQVKVNCTILYGHYRYCWDDVIIIRFDNGSGVNNLGCSVK